VGEAGSSPTHQRPQCPQEAWREPRLRAVRAVIALAKSVGAPMTYWLSGTGPSIGPGGQSTSGRVG